MRCDNVVGGRVVLDVSKIRPVFIFKVGECKQMIILAVLDCEDNNSGFCAKGSPDLTSVGCHILYTDVFYPWNSPLIALNTLKPKVI